jgi:hypothetical protein
MILAEVLAKLIRSIPKAKPSDRLMAYGFGKPPQAIEAHFTEQRRQILGVRWMPPDPNDHSKLIEPEPD